MRCAGCGSSAVTQRPERTARGHRRFRRRGCGKRSDGRSAGPLDRARYPSSDVVAPVVLRRLRDRRTPRDPAETFLVRGIAFGHQAVRDREAKPAPVPAGELRRRRHGGGGAGSRRWRVAETCLRIDGRGAHLCRAVGRGGRLVAATPGEHRDVAAARAFFRSAESVAGRVPDRVTTDGHGSHPRAIRAALGRRVVHRCGAYENNRRERDRRGAEGRTRGMRGFTSFASAARFRRTHGEPRDLLRPRTHHNQHVSADRRRLLHLRRANAAPAILAAA